MELRKICHINTYLDNIDLTKNCVAEADCTNPWLGFDPILYMCNSCPLIN